MGWARPGLGKWWLRASSGAARSPGGASSLLPVCTPSSKPCQFQLLHLCLNSGSCSVSLSHRRTIPHFTGKSLLTTRSPSSLSPDTVPSVFDGRHTRLHHALSLAGNPELGSYGEHPAGGPPVSSHPRLEHRPKELPQLPCEYHCSDLSLIKLEPPCELGIDTIQVPLPLPHPALVT